VRAGQRAARQLCAFNLVRESWLVHSLKGLTQTARESRRPTKIQRPRELRQRGCAPRQSECNGVQGYDMVYVVTTYDRRSTRGFTPFGRRRFVTRSSTSARLDVPTEERSSYTAPTDHGRSLSSLIPSLTTLRLKIPFIPHPFFDYSTAEDPFHPSSLL
jgi:hypothetical protein